MIWQIGRGKYLLEPLDVVHISEEVNNLQKEHAHFGVILSSTFGFNQEKFKNFDNLKKNNKVIRNYMSM